jgi:hypothetical protein
MDIPELIGWFCLSVLVAGIAFYRFGTAARDAFYSWLFGIFGIGLCWNFAEKYTDFMHLDSRLWLSLFFVIPHVVAFFCAYLVVKLLNWGFE